jgi:hypothetical protein
MVLSCSGETLDRVDMRMNRDAGGLAMSSSQTRIETMRDRYGCPGRTLDSRRERNRSNQRYFLGLGVLQTKPFVDQKRVRIILLRSSQHIEVTQQIRVIKSWQGLWAHCLSETSLRQLANGSSIPATVQIFPLSGDLAEAIAVQLGANNPLSKRTTRDKPTDQ